MQQYPIYLGTSQKLCFTGAGTNYKVRTPNGNIYIFMIGNGSTKTEDVYYIKSTDGGKNYATAVLVKFSTFSQLSIWYDRWSGIAAGLIHLAYTDSTNGNVYYVNIDTENADTISTEYTIFNGASTADGGTLSISRTRGGNLICGGCIDAGTEPFCYKSTNVGVNWSSIAAVAEATLDQLILLPGFAADNQDAICIYYDNSANEISRKLYDDSANSWAESSIATSVTFPAATSSYPHFSACVDLANSQIWMVSWTVPDTNLSDLRCWKITETAITEVTNVITDSADDQALCGININSSNGYLTVYYVGNSTGTQIFGEFINVYKKISTNNGTTWGAQTFIRTPALNMVSLVVEPISTVYDVNYNGVYVIDWSETSDAANTAFTQIVGVVEVKYPRTTFQLGM